MSPRFIRREKGSGEGAGGEGGRGPRPSRYGAPRVGGSRPGSSFRGPRPEWQGDGERGGSPRPQRFGSERSAPEGGRFEGRRKDARRFEAGRPDARRPDVRRLDARRPEGGRPEGRRPEGRPTEEGTAAPRFDRFRPKEGRSLDRRPGGDRPGRGKPFGARPEGGRPGARPGGGRFERGGPAPRGAFRPADRRPERASAWGEKREPAPSAPVGGINGPGGEATSERFGVAPAEDMIWGRHPAQAALEADRPIHRIWCTPELRFSPKFLQLLREAKASGVLVEEVTWARLGQLTDGAVHQGIVLQTAAAETFDLETLITACRGLDEAPLLMAVDGLTDPHNLGAIVRSAEALGAHGLVLPQRRSAGLTGSVAKVAAGALEHLPVARVVNLNRSLDSLKQEGYRVVGLAEEGTVSLMEADLDGPLVIVTGSEGEGLSMLTRKHCDQLVRIPLRGATPSLNASVATALLLYEVARRGWMRHISGSSPAPRLVRPQLRTAAKALSSASDKALGEAASADIVLTDVTPTEPVSFDPVAGANSSPSAPEPDGLEVPPSGEPTAAPMALPASESGLVVQADAEIETSTLALIHEPMGVGEEQTPWTATAPSELPDPEALPTGPFDEDIQL